MVSLISGEYIFPKGNGAMCFQAVPCVGGGGRQIYPQPELKKKANARLDSCKPTEGLSLSSLYEVTAVSGRHVTQVTSPSPIGR